MTSLKCLLKLMYCKLYYFIIFIAAKGNELGDYDITYSDIKILQRQQQEVRRNGGNVFIFYWLFFFCVCALCLYLVMVLIMKVKKVFKVSILWRLFFFKVMASWNMGPFIEWVIL